MVYGVYVSVYVVVHECVYIVWHVHAYGVLWYMRVCVVYTLVCVCVCTCMYGV